MGHGFALNREAKLAAYGHRFAEAGIATIAFDYRGFGVSEGMPRQHLSISQQLEDWRAAIAFARDHPSLRADAVAAWGFSFGGGHVLTLSMERLGLAAVIAVCPFVDGLRTAMSMPPKNAVRLIGAGLFDRLGQRFRQKPRWVPVTGDPGSFGVLTQRGSIEGFRRLNSGWSNFDNRVTAGQFVTIFCYRPWRSLRKSVVPVLIHAGERDWVFPVHITTRLAGRQSRAAISTFPAGHFDLFEGELFELAVKDQIEFLQTHFPMPPPLADARPVP
jgi:uncharacterized protein